LDEFLEDWEWFKSTDFWVINFLIK
jgi:hypothetical protein